MPPGFALHVDDVGFERGPEIEVCYGRFFRVSSRVLSSSGGALFLFYFAGKKRMNGASMTF